MAKAVSSKKASPAKKTAKPRKKAATKAPSKASAKTPTKTAKVKKAVTGAGKKAAALASNPAVAEIVAATLVATASALRNPRKARAMAASVGDELTAASKRAAKDGAAFWALAMDIARRSIEALGADSGGKRKAAAKKKAKKKG